MKKLNNNIIKILSMVMLLLMSVTSKAQTQAVFRTVSAENKVAILPITYIGDGNPVRMEEMRYRLQHIAYLCLKESATELKFQDPAETNALLLRNGVNESNFREFTPKELADILKVEYVLAGMVSQESTGTATVSHSNRRDYNHRGRYGRQTTGHTKTMEELNTNIDLDIYNDKGETIFSKSRRSILPGVGAYKNAIQYYQSKSV